MTDLKCLDMALFKDKTQVGVPVSMFSTPRATLSTISCIHSASPLVTPQPRCERILADKICSNEASAPFAVCPPPSIPAVKPHNTSTSAATDAASEFQSPSAPSAPCRDTAERSEAACDADPGTPHPGPDTPDTTATQHRLTVHLPDGGDDDDDDDELPESDKQDCHSAAYCSSLSYTESQSVPAALDSLSGAAAADGRTCFLTVRSESTPSGARGAQHAFQPLAPPVNSNACASSTNSAVPITDASVRSGHVSATGSSADDHLCGPRPLVPLACRSEVTRSSQTNVVITHVSPPCTPMCADTPVCPTHKTDGISSSPFTSNQTPEAVPPSLSPPVSKWPSHMQFSLHSDPVAAQPAEVQAVGRASQRALGAVHAPSSSTDVTLRPPPPPCVGGARSDRAVEVSSPVANRSQRRDLSVEVECNGLKERCPRRNATYAPVINKSSPSRPFSMSNASASRTPGPPRAGTATTGRLHTVSPLITDWGATLHEAIAAAARAARDVVPAAARPPTVSSDSARAVSSSSHEKNAIRMSAAAAAAVSHDATATTSYSPDDESRAVIYPPPTWKSRELPGGTVVCAAAQDTNNLINNSTVVKPTTQQCASIAAAETSAIDSAMSPSGAQLRGEHVTGFTEAQLNAACDVLARISALPDAATMLTGPSAPSAALGTDAAASLGKDCGPSWPAVCADGGAPRVLQVSHQKQSSPPLLESLQQGAADRLATGQVLGGLDTQWPAWFSSLLLSASGSNQLLENAAPSWTGSSVQSDASLLSSPTSRLWPGHALAAGVENVLQTTDCVVNDVDRLQLHLSAAYKRSEELPSVLRDAEALVNYVEERKAASVPSSADAAAVTTTTTNTARMLGFSPAGKPSVLDLTTVAAAAAGASCTAAGSGDRSAAGESPAHWRQAWSDEPSSDSWLLPQGRKRVSTTTSSAAASSGAVKSPLATHRACPVVNAAAMPAAFAAADKDSRVPGTSRAQTSSISARPPAVALQQAVADCSAPWAVTDWLTSHMLTPTNPELNTAPWSLITGASRQTSETLAVLPSVLTGLPQPAVQLSANPPTSVLFTPDAVAPVDGGAAAASASSSSSRTSKAGSEAPPRALPNCVMTAKTTRPAPPGQSQILTSNPPGCTPVTAASAPLTAPQGRPPGTGACAAMPVGSWIQPAAAKPPLLYRRVVFPCQASGPVAAGSGGVLMKPSSTAATSSQGAKSQSEDGSLLSWRHSVPHKDALYGTTTVRQTASEDVASHFALPSNVLQAMFPTMMLSTSVGDGTASVVPSAVAAPTASSSSSVTGPAACAGCAPVIPPLPVDAIDVRDKQAASRDGAYGLSGCKLQSNEGKGVEELPAEVAVSREGSAERATKRSVRDSHGGGDSAAKEQQVTSPLPQSPLAGTTSSRAPGTSRAPVFTSAMRSASSSNAPRSKRSATLPAHPLASEAAAAHSATQMKKHGDPTDANVPPLATDKVRLAPPCSGAGCVDSSTLVVRGREKADILDAEGRSLCAAAAAVSAAVCTPGLARRPNSGTVSTTRSVVAAAAEPQVLRPASKPQFAGNAGAAAAPLGSACVVSATSVTNNKPGTAGPVPQADAVWNQAASSALTAAQAAIARPLPPTLVIVPKPRAAKGRTAAGTTAKSDLAASQQPTSASPRAGRGPCSPPATPAKAVCTSASPPPRKAPTSIMSMQQHSVTHIAHRSVENALAAILTCKRNI